MRKITLIGVLLLLVVACKKDAKTEWDTDVLAPLASTSLSIDDLVKDSLAEVNSDNTVSLVFRSTIYELNLADQYIQIPDTSIGQKRTVDSLAIAPIHIEYRTSLGFLAKTMAASSDAGQQFFGNYLLNNNGNNANIPPINNFSLAPVVFDASSFFQTMTLSRGKLDYWMVNHLPIPITNVVCEAKNHTTGEVLLTDNIPYIAPYDSIYRLYDLAGKTVNSSIDFAVTSFNSPGSSSPVLIDTSDYINIHGRIFDLRASYAIARFPSQDIISTDQEITQDIGERKFTFIDCKSGTLNVEIKSSIQENFKLTYRLKGAYDRYGNGIQAISQIPAATPGNPSVLNQSYDLSGFSIGLTGSLGNKFNTYTQLVVAHIDSSGILREITSSDSVYVTYRLQNIHPNYIKGYAGRDTILFSGDSPFEFTNLFSTSAPNALQFENVNLTLNIENGLGVDGVVKVNSLSGTNANGNTITLTDNAVIGQPLHINRATDFPLTPANQNFAINSSTSNITSFLNNLPNAIHYDVDIKTNPSGNGQTYDDFAYLDSRLKVNLDLNIPLSFKSNNLILRDTFDFKLGNSPKEIDNINDGILYLITDNKFPITADLTLVAYDSLGAVVDTLLSHYTLQSASVDATCRSMASIKNTLPINAPNERIKKLFTAKKAVLTAVFNTDGNNATCNGQYFKIYSDYKLNAKITARFNYKVKF